MLETIEKAISVIRKQSDLIDRHFASDPESADALQRNACETLKELGLLKTQLSGAAPAAMAA